MLHVVKESKDPYEIAIVAYALTLVNSIDGEAAFNILDGKMRESGRELNAWLWPSLLLNMFMKFPCNFIICFCVWLICSLLVLILFLILKEGCATGRGSMSLLNFLRWKTTGRTSYHAFLISMMHRMSKQPLTLFSYMSGGRQSSRKKLSAG